MLFATILASSMAFIDSSALNVALPAIQADLRASGAQLLWIINAYLLMLAALIMIGGSLGDKLGRKKVFLSGIGLFLLASLACGLAPTADFLSAARVVQGVGHAALGGASSGEAGRPSPAGAPAIPPAPTPAPVPAPAPVSALDGASPAVPPAAPGA